MLLICRPLRQVPHPSRLSAGLVQSCCQSSQWPANTHALTVSYAGKTSSQPTTGATKHRHRPPASCCGMQASTPYGLHMSILLTDRKLSCFSHLSKCSTKAKLHKPPEQLQHNTSTAQSVRQMYEGQQLVLTSLRASWPTTETALWAAVPTAA